MHQLGDQWIEIIDGQEHIVKAVEGRKICEGCLYNGNGGNCEREEVGNACGSFIIKDLGILNEDGCLPSSWGGYPEVIRVGKPNFVTYFKVSLVVKYGDGSGIQIHVTGKTKQQAIDAWNRRA